VRAARDALAAYAAPSPSARAGPAAPQASVAVGGGAARLALTVDLPYPADLARVSRQVRDHVRERVALLTGMRITEVTLVIEHLIPSGGLESRRVR
ncbi:Asp23/Gls24 family envelope stress response protein, partial [Streptomyces sp. NPDC031705]|uniref:Asp23/Gls24 family envelope stress response protein n=1 Tax=Streptomyces sp. NPDC031705 TaxID=3155729 RepID=UPI0033E35048